MNSKIKYMGINKIIKIVSIALFSALGLCACTCPEASSKADAAKKCSSKPVSILILCTGNSCRSQMAHGFMESFDSSLYVRSGGVEPAKQVNPKAIKAMKEIGIDISDHKPCGMANYVNEDWDFVVTVCGHAEETCPAFVGKVGKRIHMPFDDPSHVKGTDEFIWSEFMRVRGEIQTKFRKLYDEEMKPLKAKRAAK